MSDNLPDSHFPNQLSGWGWIIGSPYTSLVEACSILASSLIASPSILIAPITDVLAVWIRVMLIMNGRCRTGQIIDFIYFSRIRISDIMPHHLKWWLSIKWMILSFEPVKKLIQAYHVMTFVYKPCTEMRAYKTGSATYQYSFHSKYFYCLLKRRLSLRFVYGHKCNRICLKLNNFRKKDYFKKKQI